MHLRTRWGFLLICFLFQPSTQDCVQNANGFSDLPTGSAIVSDPNYNAGGLQTYYDMVIGFIDAVLPEGYQEIVRILIPTLVGSGLSSATVTNIQSHLTQILVWNIGLLVLVALGLLFIIAFFLSCCCFCCCRLCGNCGAQAHVYKHKHQHVKCVLVTTVLLLSLSIAIPGAVVELLSNHDITQAITSINGTISSASTDALNYVTNTVEEVQVILGHLNCTLGRILNVVNEVSQSINLQNQFAPFFATAEGIQAAARDLTTTIEQLDNTSLALQELAMSLSNSLSAIATGLDSLKSNCSMSSACNGVPSGNSIRIHNSLNSTSKSLNLTTLKDNLQNVDTTIADIIQDGNITIANISNSMKQWVNSSSVLNTITSTVNTIKNPVDRFSNTSNGLVQKSNALLSKGTSELPNINGLVSTYDLYRYWAFAGFGIAILVIILFFILSLLCGLFGFSNKVHPHERNGLSHSGAIFLLLTTALSALVVLITMFITVLIMILGTQFQKICETISAPSYPMFSEVVDNTALWGGVTLIGNLSASMLHVPVNISLSQTLRRCEQNASLWDAANGDTILMGLSSQLPSAFQNITLDSLQNPNSLIPDFNNTLDEVTQALTDALKFDLTSSVDLTFLDSLIPFNVDSYKFNVLQFNLTDVQANLTSLIMALQNSSNTTSLVASAMHINDSLTNLSLTLIPQVQNKSDELYSVLKGLVVQINFTANATRSLLGQANTTVANIVADGLNKFESIYNGIVSDVTSFGKNTALAVRGTLGACKPLWAVYTAATNTFCKEILNGMNGYWFGMAWSIIFLLPTMVCAIILTAYLRRARTKIEMGSMEVYENEHINMKKFERHTVDATLQYPMDLPNVPSDEW